MRALLLAPLALALAASTASAFPTGSQFDLDPMKFDGAGGIAFDGSPRWTGHTCAVCHTNTPGKIGLQLQADHPELFTDGWTPGMQYHLRVVLVNDWAGVQYKANGDNCGGALDPYMPCDQNGFSLEIDDSDGKAQGKWVPVANNACANSGTIPPDVDIRVLTDGSAVTHNGAHHAQTQWDVCWTAPAAGTGVLTAYLAVVDGNGGSGMNFPADTVGDDVAAGALPMNELGGTPPPPQNGGCDASGPDAGAAFALVVLALAFGLRRRRGLAALLALGIAAGTGCGHVHATQRETLARPNMKFGPDPIEDELDLHMQEAREGSSGGYGSSGGGCGCN